jgi:hypothetical protein
MLPHHPTDRPPKGWTAEAALGLGLVALAAVLGAALFLLAWLFAHRP